MKKIIPLAITLFSLGSAGYAAPFMAIGDGAELFVTGTLGVRADDNIFLAANADSDLIFDITPGVDLTFGKDSQLSGNLTLGLAFANYSDNSNLNTNLFTSNFSTRYDDGKLKMGFNVGFNELNQNSVDIRGLTRRDVFNAGGNAEVEVSQLTSVGGGITFNHDNYKRASYGDSDTLTVPLNVYYKWTPKVDLSFGYRYRDYTTTIGSDSTDHFISIGARGDFTPKLKGKFSVGLNTRRLAQGGEDNQVGLDSSFTYEISPKTELMFGATNDFNTSPQGAQQKNFALNGALNFKLTDDWSATAGLSYRATDYGTRTDDYLEGNLGATYIVNANIRIVGAWVYRNYSSVLTASEFTNNVFSVAANFRY